MNWLTKTIYENYVIYSDCRVFSNKRQGTNGHWLKISVNIHGYAFFKIWLNGKCKNLQLHRELAKAFIPNPKKLPCVNHKDGNKLNNSLSNLEWCTHSENNSHSHQNGLRKSKNTTGHKYISYDRGTKKPFRVSVNFGERKVIKGGRHHTIEEALAERDNIISKHGK